MIRARETFASPLSELSEMLLGQQPRWLAAFLRLACMEAEHAAARLYGETVTQRPGGSKAAAVDVGTPLPHPDGESMLIPIRWRVQGYRILPTRFDGKLELIPAAADGTEVDLYGNWTLDPRDQPDFSTRLAVRAATETALQRLLANIRVALEESARAPV